jgi:tetratricopeptide (TPR) repeat protein
MRFARIVFALDINEREAAEKLYKGFAKADYKNASETAFHAAQSAELLGYLREAIGWYESVTGERALRAGMRRAFLYAQLGEIQEARNLLAQIRIQTDNGIRSQSYQTEAQILQGANQNDTALELLSEALRLMPGDTGLRYSRALLAVTLLQLELAENDLRQIIQVQPDNAAALNALGYTLADLTDRYDEAEKLIFLAFELQPEDPSIIDSMGWISYRMGRLEEAERYLRQAWLLLRNAEVAAHLGEVLWARGQTDEARSLWQLGMQLDRDNVILINTIKRLDE